MMHTTVWGPSACCPTLLDRKMELKKKQKKKNQNSKTRLWKVAVQNASGYNIPVVLQEPNFV